MNISTKQDYESDNQRPKTDFYPLLHILEYDFCGPSLRQVITIKAFLRENLILLFNQLHSYLSH